MRGRIEQLLKGIVHPKMKNLPFAHSHVVPNCIQKTWNNMYDSYGALSLFCFVEVYRSGFSAAK